MHRTQHSDHLNDLEYESGSRPKTPVTPILQSKPIAIPGSIVDTHEKERTALLEKLDNLKLQLQATQKVFIVRSLKQRIDQTNEEIANLDRKLQSLAPYI